jgi:hypothetical protein
MEGIDKTNLGIDERVNRFGYGDPSDSRRVNEIEYDPIKIGERQAQTKESHDFGLSH